MSKHPTPVNRLDERPLYQQVEQRIEQLIQTQQLQPGDAIPGANRLAELLDVNYLTVRRAIGNLTQRGVLIARTGRGTFVAQNNFDQRVLFVCGTDLFRGDVSEYYLRSFHYARQCLDQRGYKLHPVWLSNNRHSDATPYCNAQKAREQVGYLFYGCRNNHPLLNYAVDNHLPYVNVSSRPSQRYHVQSNRPQAYEMAMQRLIDKGHRKITLVGIDLIHAGPNINPYKKDAAEIAQRLGVDLELMTIPEQRYTSEYETAGYELMASLLQRPQPPRALLVTDNIIGQGLTRALLERRPRFASRMAMVMFCGLQQIMPLGLPVDLLVFDIHEQADRAVDLLLEQLAGREPDPSSQTTAYWLIDHQRLTTDRQTNLAERLRTRPSQEAAT